MNKVFVSCCVASLLATGAFADEACGEDHDHGHHEDGDLSLSLEDILITPKGSVDVRATYFDMGEEDDSELELYKVRLGFDAYINEYIDTDVLVEWTEEHDFELHNAMIHFRNEDMTPFSAGAGRGHAPFGWWATKMASDHMLKEMGEVNKDHAYVAYANDYFGIKASVFDSLDEEDDGINNGTVSFTVTPTEELLFNVAYVTDIKAAGHDHEHAEDEHDSEHHDEYEKTAGVSVFARTDFHPVKISAAYITATDDIEEQHGNHSHEYKPQVWYVEADYEINHDWLMAVRYEGTKEFEPEENPEMQLGAAVTYSFDEYTSVTAQYELGQFESDELDDRHMVTLKVAVGF